MSELALFLHLAGAFLLIAGITLAGAAFEVARRRASPAEIAALLSLARVGVLLVAGGTVLVAAAGVWLVDTAGFSFGEAWLRWATALFAISLVVGAGAGRRPRRARRHAEDLAAAGQDGDERLRILLGDPVSRAANYASLALLVAVIALMVFK